MELFIYKSELGNTVSLYELQELPLIRQNDFSKLN